MPARQAVISLPITQRAHLERFDATEGLSELFEIQAYVICEEADVDFLPHLGEAALIMVTQDDESHREFSGLIYEAEFIDEVAAGFRYRLTLRPWLYALSRNRDYRIFQNQSVTQIIEAVFNSRNCSAFDLSKLTKSYQPRDYCVQYSESDFAFVSRLMEAAGIYYFFRHENGRHEMVLCDGRGSHEHSEVAGLDYNATRSQSAIDRVWRWTEKVTTGAEGKVTFRNYDFERPSTKLESDKTLPPIAAAAAAAGDSRIEAAQDQAPLSFAAPAETAEVYDYPRPFLDSGSGEDLTQFRLEAIHNMRRSYQAEGDAAWLSIGELITLTHHPLSRLNQDYLLVRIRYAVSAETFVSGGAGEEGIQVNADSIPASAPWRAPFATQRPVVRGPDTAVVTGPAGETIYTDKYGRVKVRFFWDRADPSADNTCWIRVSDSSADGDFGHLVLPRVGQEVVVDFIDGDPDRPLITGRVYNGTKNQAYALPANKTRSVWRSHTIDGGADDFNEISMEDKTGEEEMKLVAQKDRNTLVKNNESLTVNNDRRMTVNGFNTEIIGKDERVHVKGNQFVSIDQNQQTIIEKDQAVSINQNKTEVIGQDRITNVSGSDTNNVFQGKKIRILGGDYNVSVEAGAAKIEALNSITLQVGANKLVLDQTGLTIDAILISIKAEADMSLQAPVMSVQGQGMLTLAGGIVMIN